MITRIAVWSCCIGISLAGSVGVGQEQEAEFETDRDSFTQALTVIGKHRLAAETAWSFVDNRNSKETHSFPELLLRYGLTDNIELRLGANYEVGGEPSVVSHNGGSAGGHIRPAGSALEEEASLSYGVKAQLSSQRGLIPLSALTLRGTTPTSGQETASNFLMGYVFGWELPNEWIWASEIRYGKSSSMGDNFNSWAPSTVLKIPVHENTHVHAEYFGVFSDGTDEVSVRQFFDVGASHMLTPDFEVGIRTGWGLNTRSANFFTNVGVGWRY